MKIGNVKVFVEDFRKYLKNERDMCICEGKIFSLDTKRIIERIILQCDKLDKRKGDIVKLGLIKPSESIDGKAVYFPFEVQSVSKGKISILKYVR